MFPDPWTITGNTLGAGSLSPKSTATSSSPASSAGGYFMPQFGSTFFGDMNTQYGGIGGATSSGMLGNVLMLAAIGAVILWLRKK